MAKSSGGLKRVLTYQAEQRFECCEEIEAGCSWKDAIAAPFSCRFHSFGAYSTSEKLMIEQIRVGMVCLLLAPLPVAAFESHYITRYFPCWMYGRTFELRLKNEDTRTVQFGFTFDVTRIAEQMSDD